MRVLVFSDIHGNGEALEKFISLLPRLSFDGIVFLGDIFGYYYEQEKCIEILKSISGLIWLKGNHDAYAVEAYYNNAEIDHLIKRFGHSYDSINNRFSEQMIREIDSLQFKRECFFGGKKIGLFHGRPKDPIEGRIYNDTYIPYKEICSYDIVFFGHTHCKIDRIIEKTRILSPGSLGQPRDGKGYGFLIYDFEKSECQFMNVDVDNSLLREYINKYDSEKKELYGVLEREECKWQ